MDKKFTAEDRQFILSIIARISRNIPPDYAQFISLKIMQMPIEESGGTDLDDLTIIDDYLELIEEEGMVVSHKSVSFVNNPYGYVSLLSKLPYNRKLEKHIYLDGQYSASRMKAEYPITDEVRKALDRLHMRILFDDCQRLSSSYIKTIYGRSFYITYHVRNFI